MTALEQFIETARHLAVLALSFPILFELAHALRG